MRKSTTALNSEGAEVCVSYMLLVKTVKKGIVLNLSSLNGTCLDTAE